MQSDNSDVEISCYIPFTSYLHFNVCCGGCNIEEEFISDSVLPNNAEIHPNDTHQSDSSDFNQTTDSSLEISNNSDSDCEEKIDFT